jgi:hypothetical protein
MDKKDYAIAFLASLCISFVIQFSGFNFSTLQWQWPYISEETQLYAVCGFSAVALLVLVIILAYRLKHTQINGVQ